MKRLITISTAALVISAGLATTSFAQQIGGPKKIIKDPDFGTTYVGQYKYSHPVTYVDYQGNTVTGTAWEYVDVTSYTMQECNDALSSAQFWGATVTIGCHAE